MDREFLLKTYGQCYDAEAGPWNLSLQNKNLEYVITRFFEENFTVRQGADLCNIGIGAGYWDRYLSYRLTGRDADQHRHPEGLLPSAGGVPGQ